MKVTERRVQRSVAQAGRNGLGRGNGVCKNVALAELMKRLTDRGFSDEAVLQMGSTVDLPSMPLPGMPPITTELNKDQEVAQAGRAGRPPPRGGPKCVSWKGGLGLETPPPPVLRPRLGGASGWSHKF
jgi:hypothetical protein